MQNLVAAVLCLAFVVQPVSISHSRPIRVMHYYQGNAHYFERPGADWFFPKGAPDLMAAYMPNFHDTYAEYRVVTSRQTCDVTVQPDIECALAISVKCSSRDPIPPLASAILIIGPERVEIPLMGAGNRVVFNTVIPIAPMPGAWTYPVILSTDHMAAARLSPEWENIPDVCLQLRVRVF